MTGTGPSEKAGKRPRKGAAQDVSPEAEAVAGLEVSFPQGSAPPPIFAGVCVVHRFPEYVLLDLGSIDPLRVEQTDQGQKAVLQHTGRVSLPLSVAKRLLQDLTNLFGALAG